MKYCNLGDIAEIIAGQSPPSKTYNKQGIGLPFLQGKADYGKVNPVIRTWCSEPSKIALPGDILISVRAPVGPVNINNVESCIGRGLSAIRVKESISSDYIYYFLKSNEVKIANLGVGSTFKAITQKDLKKIIIPLPNLNEQVRIVNLLSRIESLIAQRRESIRLLNEFLKSTFFEIFGDPVKNEKGWEKKVLRDVADVLTGFAFESKKYTNNESDVKICGGLIVFPGCINWNEATTWPKEDTNGLEKYKLKAGDIILALDRPWITSGFKIAMITKNDPESLLIQRTARIRTEQISKEYLYFILNHRIFKQHCKPTETTVPHISPREIQFFEMPIPSETLQAQFSQIFKRSETIRDNFGDNLFYLEQLYCGLSQEAFKH